MKNLERKSLKELKAIRTYYKCNWQMFSFKQTKEMKVNLPKIEARIKELDNERRGRKNESI